MAQMLVECGKPEANLERAEGYIRKAAAEGATIVVLPECLDLGWTEENSRKLAQPIPGPHSERLARAARAASIYVVAGLVERDGERL
jgi:predicted amidohydrolase